MTVPQVAVQLKQLAVDTLAVYASSCRYFITLAPDAVHADTLKVCEDVEVKKMMAHFVARHRLHEMNVAGRLIAEFF